MIVLPQYDLEIRTCPKVLSTSLKAMAFELEHGRELEPRVTKGHLYSVHSVFPSRPFEMQEQSSMKVRVAFVRDPVERFLSLYKNRILTKHQLSQADFAKLPQSGLDPNPSLNQLIRNLNRYRKNMPTIDHHAALQVDYLGSDIAYYDRIFTIEQVPDFEDFMSGLAGTEVRLPFHQRSGSKAVEMSWMTEQRIRWYYRRDYRAFSQVLESGSWVRG